MADVVVVNKMDSAEAEAVGQVVRNVQAVNPAAAIVKARSPVTLEPGPSLAGARVLVIDDGPTITHGGMPFGAATVAARAAGAITFVDPRPYAVGSIRKTFEDYPAIGAVLPAMGYSDAQLRDLEGTINAAECDAVVAGTPIDLARLIKSRRPIRRATYELQEIGEPTLADVLKPLIDRAKGRRR
jgi:predicted GTPase